MPTQGSRGGLAPPRPCALCATIFRPSSANTSRGYGLYCDLRCSGIARRRKSEALVEQRFWARVRMSDGCWTWTAGIYKRRGYGRFSLNRTKGVMAHRFAYELTHGPIPDGLMVCHRCDNPPCVRPDHLFLGTAADNSRDMVQKRRSTLGAKNPNAKLNDAKVAAIRAAVAENKLTHGEIARRFGIGRANLYYVASGRTWTHVQ